MRSLICCLVLLWLPSPLQAQDPNYQMSLSSAAGGIGGEVTINVNFDFPNATTPIAAWNLGVCDDERVELISVDDGFTMLQLNPAFSGFNEIPGQGWTIGVLISFAGNVLLEPGSGYQLHRAHYSLLAEGVSNIELCSNLGSPAVPTDVTLPSQAAVVPVTSPGVIDIGLFAPMVLSASTADGAAGAATTIAVQLDNPVAVDAFSFGLTHDASTVSATEVIPGSGLAALNGGSGADFFSASVDPVGVDGVLVGCLVSFGPVFDSISPAVAGAPHEIARVTYQVAASVPSETVTMLEFSDALGNPPLPTTVSVEGVSLEPVRETGSITVTVGDDSLRFVRGDIDSNGNVELIDAILLLRWLFGTGAPGNCEAAADIDDNGELSGLPDGVALLNYLFTGGAMPAVPSSCLESDLTPDSLDCDESSCTR